MPDFDVRALTLGPAFNPRVEDIKTPDALTARGTPDDLLRLVSLSATERLALLGTLGDDEAKNWATLTCAVVRYRDAGGEDGYGTYVYGKLDDNGKSVPNYVDAAAMAAKDFELVNMWTGIVRPFLKLMPIDQAVEQAKNGSQVTPSSGGGTVSPTTSESQPSETVNPA